MQEKKQIKEKNELKREKWDVEEKYGVLKTENYSKTCWLRGGNSIQLQIYKLRVFNNKHFSKTWKIHILKTWPNTLVRHRVVRVPYLKIFFVQWLTKLTWCELPGLYRSMIVMVFLVPESRSRWPIICCIWSWTCLAALEDFDVVGVQKWTKSNHGAPVQLLFQILGLSSAWWRIGSQRNFTLLSLLPISKSYTRRSIYARPAC